MHLLIHADYRDLAMTNIGCILTDPPYGVTQNQWDKVPADFIATVLPWMVDDGSIVSTADMRYAAFLLSKYPTLFSHDLVWQKTVGSGQLNIKRRPLRTHENILVFNKGKGFYRRVFSEGDPYKVSRKITQNDCYGEQVAHIAENDGKRDMKTVLSISNPRKKGGHPTQKPVALFQKLCDSYGNGVILDPFAGSGTILDISGYVTIGVEKDDGYYRAARDSRQDRILTAEHAIDLQQFIPALQDTEFTVLKSKS